MIRIIVGSTSPIKIEAVKAAVANLGLEAEVRGIETESGVHPQPYGMKETLQGALNRAYQVQASHPEAALAIGIENGLVPAGETAHGDLAYVAILTPEHDIFVRRSDAVPVPAEIVRAAMSLHGQAVTAGSLEVNRSGCPADDPHRVWSGGKTDRKTILTKAITRALLAATTTEEGETP